MKILMLAPYSSPIVQRLSKALEKYTEYEVWVASFNVETDLKRKIISLGEINSFLDYFKFYKVNKLVRDLNPDLVHAHILNHYGFMAILQNKPLLVGLWGSDVMLAPNTGSLLKRKIFTLINTIVLRRANFLHTSSDHILDELKNKHGKYVVNKTHVFYWGFPVEEPEGDEYKSIESKFKEEFGIDKKDHLIVFPRGLSSVYDPENAIKIIEKLVDISSMKIVVLRGFASNEDVGRFKEKLGDNLNKIVFIDKLLNSNELFVLYSQTKYHVSIPKSDALGGGVVEPLIRGSIPILSNIEPYKKFIRNNPGIVLEDYTDLSLIDLRCNMSSNTFEFKSTIVTDNFSAKSIVDKFEKIYVKISK
ncbi:glycosyltransferase [Acinetobacter junii]|uniref:glycosyltransferase n=1 Tax=Acinetobacter junii TaxID=40215 RepID=UPI003A8C6E1E